MVVSIDPDGVLAVSAATLLVSQDLSLRGTTLQVEIDAVGHLVGYRPVFSGRVNATVGIWPSWRDGHARSSSRTSTTRAPSSS